MSRVCQYLVIQYFHSPMPWNYDGIMSRIERFICGPKSFAAFNQFMSLGGTYGFVEALQKQMCGLRIKSDILLQRRAKALIVIDCTNAKPIFENVNLETE